MRICGLCKTNKEDSEFYKKGKYIHAYCKLCFNRYCVDRWIQRKKDAVKYKGGECTACGYNKHYEVLEFHHVDPSKKDFDWNKMRLKNWEKVLKELDKCILVCSNCHKEIHIIK